MNTLDRDFMKHILETLVEKHPSPLLSSQLLRQKTDEATLATHADYLDGNGLIKAEWYGSPHTTVNATAYLKQAALTPKGRGFLESEDGKRHFQSKTGSLEELFGTVTVKIHQDTIKDLISARIQEASLSPAEKQRYLDQLQSLPAETTKHLVLSLVDAALTNWKKALPLLQNIFG